MKKILFIILIICSFSLQVFAKPPIIDLETNTIEMLNKRDDGGIMIFSVDIARIGVGESITWLPTDKMHNVEWKNGPDGAELPKKSKFSKKFKYIGTDIHQKKFKNVIFDDITIYNKNFLKKFNVII